MGTAAPEGDLGIRITADIEVIGILEDLFTPIARRVAKGRLLGSLSH
jgi:hypothetical protein